MDYSGVLVMGEQRNGAVHPVTYELIARGRTLADKLGVKLTCVVIGDDLEAYGEEIIQRGADIAYLLDDPGFAWFLPRRYSAELAELIEEIRPEIVLAAATTEGRTLMPCLAGRLGAGLTADCTELDIDLKERLLLQTRPAIGGNVMATIKTPTARPQIATVRPKSTRPFPRDPQRRGEIIIRRAKFDDSQFAGERFLQFVRDTSQTVNVQDAEVVVAGGKGLKTRDNFRMVEELAELLGAAVGATRDVVDLGWIGYPHQIGLSGKTVSPRMYIAIGISGTIQHLAGMQTSETIIAIDKDRDAQIFKVADYGIVGDLFDVVPRLIDGIRNVKRTRLAGSR